MKEENEFATLLNSDVRFTGALHTEESMLIKGEFTHSNIRADSVVISYEGKVHDNLEVNTATVQGEVGGTIVCHDYFSLSKGGRVFGKLKTALLTVDRGGVLNADVQVTQKPRENT